ncbi:MAG: SDR family oxidoreductase [Trueperaceae bacterium]|nr:MAG: SDR family oxidoreductase [Trueperaceae bacterium]
MDLSGKVALVTGAGRGFGWGIARALARAGAEVCVTDINDDDIERTLGDIHAEGFSAIGAHLDVSELSEFERVVEETVARWNRFDILVQNAVYMPLISFEDTTPESFWRQLQVGLGGLYNGTRAAWKHFKRQGGGHIIGIASGSSIRGYKEETTYCAIKHAQEGFIKALALEAEPYKIAINTIGPGKLIKPTRLTWEELERTPEATKSSWTDPAELGKAFVWLASQPPGRFSGLRFDAGLIVDTIAAEGEDFPFTPEKVTMYPEDFIERQRWMAEYPD